VPSPKVASPKLIARRAARVVMNRAALDAAQLGMADALLEIGQRIIADASANAPRDPETAAKRGVPMMADTGHVVVYALGKKVGGDEGNTGKPRGMKTAKGRADLGVWFSSPISHFAELGTIKEIARPFLTPAFNRNIAGAASTVVPAMGKRIRAVPG
jgi:hypothetical protein